ncbi:MAG: GatB/YqeY domain-containing protein [Dehalococcoidia bacterium]|nr:GatB/YqeY domain-containing protein [Dehalococcoidia bacterium]
MTMKTRLSDDMKQAMRNRDVLRRDVIRYLRSEVRNQEIRDQKELDDAGVIQVLSRQAQQRRDSIEVYRDADRQDLVEKEESELSVILSYLPQQMTSEEIADLVQQVVAEVGASGPADMGKVMGAIMPQVRGKAEGREVNAIVQQTLRSL